MHTTLQKTPVKTGKSTATMRESRMHRNMRIMLCGCLYYSGLIGLVHWQKRRVEPHVVILNYHEAAGGDLRRHLLYLRKHYHIEHLETALVDFYKKKGQGKAKQKPRTTIVLTFDDGDYNNYTHCLALAKELQVPITIFLIPGYIESGHRFWWEEAKNIDRLTQLQEVTLEGKTYDMDRPAERAALLQLIDTRVRRAATVAEREQFLEIVHQALQVPAASSEEQMQLSMSWEEVQEMEASGWISFGAHTMHHPILGYLTDADEIMQEVTESRKVLEQQLKHPVAIFAYPVGKLEHIGEYGRYAVQQAGFDWAVTTVGGVNTQSTDPLMLHRIEVNLSDHWLVMAAKTTGLLEIFLDLRRFPQIWLKTLIKRA